MKLKSIVGVFPVWFGDRLAHQRGSAVPRDMPKQEQNANTAPAKPSLKALRLAKQPEPKLEPTNSKCH